MNTHPRRYPTRPFLGVGALIFNDGNLLLVERAKEPLKGYWSLPGGIVEAGEKVEDAIPREMVEEDGVEVYSLSGFEIFERIVPDARGEGRCHLVLIDLLWKPTGGQLLTA